MRTINFSVSTIRKEEFPGLVHGVLKIVEKYNPETLHINYFFGLLQDKTNLVDLCFTPMNGKHPLSDPIKKARKRRVELVLAILSQKDAVERAKLDSQTEASQVIFPLVNSYLTGFRDFNEKIAGPKLKAFLNEIEASDTLKSAATATGILPYIDELKLIQANLNENQTKRVEDKSNNKSVTGLKIKEDAGPILLNLFKSIELAEVQYPDVDYSPLVNELNEFLTPYRALNLSRSTIRENAKKETVAPSTTTSATAT